MKKERKFILTIFGIMFLTLGISITCSISDKDKGDTPNVIDPNPHSDLDQLTPLEEFTINYAGTYTANSSAVLQFQGLSMTFNENIRVSTTSATNGNIYLDISFNGAQDGSEIQRIMFTEESSWNIYTKRYSIN